MTDLHEGSKQKLSTLAMLVDCLMKYEGLSTTRELCERTGKTDSHIRKARREIAERSNVTGQIAPAVKYDRSNMTETGQIAPAEELGTLPAINTELPKGNTLSVAVGGVGEIDEIPGLNGSTPRLVQQLAEWIAGDFGVPNLKTSRDLLAGNVEFHGADKVRQGMLDLEALLASGEKPRNVSKLFAVYVKRATLEPQQRQKKESFAERQRREAFELLAEMGVLDESAAH